MTVQCFILLVSFLNLVNLVYPQCEEFMSPPPPEVSIVEGGEADIFCRHGDGPVVWFQLDRQILGDNLQSSCDCVATIATPTSPGINLTFTDFTAGSAGEYSCRATLGEIDMVVCNFNISTGEAPSVSGGADVTITVGNTLTLSPNINFGSPRATITWSLNGQDINPDDPRADISDSGVLTVSSTQNSDGGLYTIIVSNTIGNDTDSFQVLVNPNVATVSPTTTIVQTTPSPAETTQLDTTTSSASPLTTSLFLMWVVAVATGISFRTPN